MYYITNYIILHFISTKSTMPTLMTILSLGRAGRRLTDYIGGENYEEACHALAMRLVGASFVGASGDDRDFDGIVMDHTALQFDTRTGCFIQEVDRNVHFQHGTCRCTLEISMQDKRFRWMALQCLQNHGLTFPINLKVGTWFKRFSAGKQQV